MIEAPVECQEKNALSQMMRCFPAYQIVHSAEALIQTPLREITLIGLVHGMYTAILQRSDIILNING
jgi:hypothetical protein